MAVMKFKNVVLKNLFSKPVTKNYPAEPAVYPERSRGHVEIDIDTCILCGICGMNCPARTIKVDRKASTWSIDRFDCIQCGYCLVDITENNDGPIGKYIAKNGPGIQHIALRVDDIKAAIADAEAAGIKMIDKVARNGAGQMKIAFVHPKSAGCLLELCQPMATYVD